MTAETKLKLVQLVLEDRLQDAQSLIWLELAPRAGDLPVLTEDEFKLARTRKVDAIIQYRNRTQLGLRESKLAVDTALGVV